MVAAPYTVVAVTLAEESLTVLGLLDGSCDPADLRVGAEVSLVVADLFTDDDDLVHTVWAWRPERPASEDGG